MIGLDSNPQNRKNPQQSNTFFFNKGDEVEVSSEEEGFRGAWYVATILEFPTPQPQPATKSSSKKKKKAVVRYKTLVTEDGSAPLVEHVDPHLIRPLPSQDLMKSDAGFQENDAIDANLRDGWWTGVVRKALDGGSRYRVYFDNPPDIIDCHAKDLRVHLDWVDGNWVRPEMPQHATGSVFSSGTAVEVNLVQDNARDIWVPAVVVKENEDNTFWVKCQSSQNTDEAGIGRTNVDFFHIRPTPRYEQRSFELLERVDARYGFGWRPGVITKLLAGKRYNVFFKQGNEDRELNFSDIRPYLEWVDGKWISKSKEVRIVSESRELLGVTNNTDNTEVAVQLESKGATEDKTKEKTVSTSIRNPTARSTHSDETPTSHGLPPSLRKLKLALSNGGGLHSRPSKRLTDGDATEVPISVTALQSWKIPVDMSSKEIIWDFTTQKTGVKRTRCSDKLMVDVQPSAKTENSSAGKMIKSKKQDVFEMDFEKVDIITKKGRATKSPFRSPLALAAVRDDSAVGTAAQHICECDDDMQESEVPLITGCKASEGVSQDDIETLKLIKDHKKSLNDLDKDKSLEPARRSQRRKRGRPRKLILNSKALDAGKDNGFGDIANDVVVKACTVNEVELPAQTRLESKVTQTSSREKTGEFSKVDFMSREVDAAVAAALKDVADDDQPLSTWFGGMHSSSNIEESRSSGRAANGGSDRRERRVAVVESCESRDRQVVAVESSAVDTKGDGIQVADQSLPFVKRSPIWDTIESMEVFRIIPQKPHFHPLAECKEEYREGSAIGIMVTFASLFDKISSLKFDDRRSIYESTLESLVDLEKHGFDISVPHGRLKELLSIRDGQVEVLNQSKDAESKIRVHIDEKRRLEVRVNDIEKKIAELQEELALNKAKLEVKELDVSKLQSHVDSMIEQIKNARDQFGKLASAPWRSR